MDHVREGRRSMRPRALRDPAFVAVAEVLLLQVQRAEEFVIALFGVLSLEAEQAPLWALKSIGNLLDLPYSPAWSKALYLQLLRFRVVARGSRGRYDDVVRMADALRSPGTVDHAGVTVIHPEALQVAIPNLTGALQAKVRGLLLGAIQETTDLSVTAVNDTEGGVVEGLYFKFGPNGPGFNKGKLAPDL